MTTNEEMRASIRGSVHGEELKMEVKGNTPGMKVALTQIIYQMAKQGMEISDMAQAMNLGISMLSEERTRERMNEHAD